jgi:proline dehydrogenase
MDRAAAALRKAALNEDAKAYLLANKELNGLFKKGAKRYLGGDDLQESITAIKALNARGFACATDFMGESIRKEEEANKATEEFLRVCEAIGDHGLNSSISLDLSHIGLVIDKELAMQNLSKICDAAQEVMISAEGIDRTDSIQEIYKTLSGKYPHLGITVQAYLYRSKEDLAELKKLPNKIRLVKGAFEVPDHVAYKRGEELDKVYLEYAYGLLSANHHCSIATHDIIIQEAVKEILFTVQPDKESYEFESLLGIENERLAALKEEGHRCRIYVVYGKEWYLYLMNRVAEYPPGIFQVLLDILA